MQTYEIAIKFLSESGAFFYLGLERPTTESPKMLSWIDDARIQCFHQAHYGVVQGGIYFGSTKCHLLRF